MQLQVLSFVGIMIAIGVLSAVITPSLPKRAAEFFHRQFYNQIVLNDLK